MRELAEDFDLHGRKAIKAMREEKPSEYIKVVASLMPKQLEEVATDPLDGISDERLEEMIAVLDRMVEEQKLSVVDVAATVPVDAVLVNHMLDRESNRKWFLQWKQAFFLRTF